MNPSHKGALQLNFKMLALLSALVLVGGYFLWSAWFQVSRRAQTQEAEEGAEQAMAEVDRIATLMPLPPRWKKKTRRVTLALPLGNREKKLTYWVNTVGMKFVPLPTGEFLMGQDNSPKFPDADPAHRVRITRPFFMGAHEVTRAQYKAITGKLVPFRSGPQLDREPAHRVTWDDAIEFCRILSQKEGLTYRLPTEAEWEYAYRAGTATSTYVGAGGNRDLTELCCIYYQPKAIAAKDKYKITRNHPEPVGTFPANPFGLFNMAGNVSEWCQDWYAEDYYALSPMDDPQGPPSGTTHVRRGGSYETGRLGCRSYYRVSPKDTGGAGFRIVLPIDNYTQD
jgi:formylglycine-generating enzyme required for sulfatase activity